LLVLINQSRISDTTKANLGNFKKMVIVGNYLPDGLDYAKLTALESLSLFDGTMTDAMRSAIQRLSTLTLKYLEVPRWNASVSNRAFYESRIASIVGFEDVTTIDSWGFTYSRSLAFASFPKLQTVGSYALGSTGIAYGYFPCSTSFESNAFINSGLKSITMSDLTILGSRVFYNNNLQKLHLVGQSNGNNIIQACSRIANQGQSGQITDFTFSLGEFVLNEANVPNLSEYIDDVLSLSLSDVPILANATSRVLDLGAAVANTTGLTQHGGLIDVIKIGSSSYTWNGSAWT
jgi:hypothetical protein